MLAEREAEVKVETVMHLAMCRLFTALYSG